MNISIPGADYTPQLTGYTGQGAFRFWCQKVLPIVYDDSLSYYELLNKVVNYLNNVIADVANVEQNVGELNDSYISLQSYVNEHMQEIVGVVNEYTEFTTNYFNNLDVQEEINTKLDEMASDGSLSALIGPIVAITAPDIITQWLTEHITPTEPLVDNTLTISGAAADAKVTGEKVAKLKSAITSLTDTTKAYKEETDSIIKYTVNNTETDNNAVVVNVHHNVSKLKMNAISGTLGLYDGMIVLDGSSDENWSLHSSGKFYASGLGISLTVGGVNDHVSTYMYCQNSTSDTIKYFSVGSEGIYISKNADYQTVDALKSYLAAHPLTVWYKSNNYSSATTFYQCVQVYTGNSTAGIDFVHTYGTDEKFSAIGTTDFVDFIAGTITNNGEITGRFTPSVFTQRNTVTIAGGGVISITQNDVIATVKEVLDNLKSDFNTLTGTIKADKEETDSIIKYSVNHTETGNNKVVVNVQHNASTLKMNAISGTIGLYDGMIVLDGSSDENWSLHSSGRFYASGLGISLTVGGVNDHVSTYMYCQNSTSDTIKYFSVGSEGIYISKNADYQTVDALKSYLAAHPLTVWYKSNNYSSATTFYQCVQVYTGNSTAGIDFVHTYGTDEKFSAIGTTDFVDFIAGTITNNGEITGRFTPSVFTQRNTVTIAGGGVISITQNDVIATVKEVLDNLKSEVEDPTSEKNMPVIDVTSKSQVPFARLANILKGSLMYEDVMANEIIRLNRTGDVSHDGTIVKNGNMLYCVYCSYEEGSSGGDSASNETAVVRLDGISITTGERIVELVVAQKNGTYDGTEQTGGAGSPNAYIIGNNIHILYTAKMGTTYVEMHCTYNISTGTLGNYGQVSINNSPLNVAWINTKYGYNFSAGAYLNAQSNSTIATDGNGTYYIGWVWSYSTASSLSHAIIFSTSDFVNWTIFKELEYQTIPVYELPLAYVSGYLLFYFRPSVAGRGKTNNFGDDSMYGILGKIDISDQSVVQASKLQNCGSRPAFFWYEGTLYLFTNTYNRDNFEIVEIDTNYIYQSIVYSEGYGGYNYPSFAVDGTTIYFLHSGKGMQVSKYTPRSIGNADIRNTLLSVFEG